MLNKPGYFRDPLPMYSKIAWLLRGKIQSGQYESGQQLPTDKELSQAFGVSRITIRHALSLLQKDGLIARFRGRGTFVTDNSTFSKNFIPANLLDIVQALEPSVIKSIEIEKLKVSDTRIARDIINFFELSGDDIVARVQRIVWEKSTPISLREAFLMPDVARHITKKGLYRTKSIVKLLKEKTDLVIGKSEMYFEAVGLDADVAELLHCQSLNPAIRVQVFFRLDSGEPFELLNAFMRSEYFRYKVDIDLEGFEQI